MCHVHHLNYVCIIGILSNSINKYHVNRMDQKLSHAKESKWHRDRLISREAASGLFDKNDTITATAGIFIQEIC